MVTHIARVWINRVRLPILHVVSWTGKMNISLSAFAPEDLVARDGFGSPVPRQPAQLHTQAESGAYLRDSFTSFAAASIYLSSRAIAYRWRSLPRVCRHRASKAQGSSERVLPWQVTSAALADHHGPINIRLSFPHQLLVRSGHVESTGEWSPWAISEINIYM